MSCLSFSHIADVQRLGLQPCQNRTLNQVISHTFFSLVTKKKEKKFDVTSSEHELSENGISILFVFKCLEVLGSQADAHFAM